MSEIRAYAAAHKIEPSTVLQRGAGLGGRAWSKWEAGGACTVPTAEKLRAYMQENPATPGETEAAA